MNDRTLDIPHQAAYLAKKASSLPCSVQYAITKVLPYTLVGSFWGFADRKEVVRYASLLKESENHIIARQLSNEDCLLEVDPAYLLGAVNQLSPGLLTVKDLKTIERMQAEAIASFEKFLIAKGKYRDSETNKSYAGVVGIYCINEVTTINSQGISFPAFRINMKLALNLLSLYGYRIYVEGQWLNATQAANAGRALWHSTKLSPTKTGIFIKIASTYSVDKIKELEVNFKHRNGLDKVSK